MEAIFSDCGAGGPQLKRDPLGGGTPNIAMQAVFLSANELHRVASTAVTAVSGESSQSLVAVLFSCAYVEAAVNELLHQIEEAQDGPLAKLKPLARAAGLYERTASIARKIAVLGAGATGKEVDLGSPPFQDFDLLLQLRNWLVHLRPEPLSLRDNPSDSGTLFINEEYHKLIDRLVKRRVIELPQNHLLAVTGAAQLPGVAEWSLRTAEATLEQLKGWMPAWRPPIVGKVQAI